MTNSLPTVIQLTTAMRGDNPDDPISTAMRAMYPCQQQRYTSLATLMDPNPGDAAARAAAAERLAAAMAETARCIHAIDRHISTVPLNPAREAQTSPYTIGEWAAARAYVAMLSHAESSTGSNYGNAARLGKLYEAYDVARSSLLVGTARLPERASTPGTILPDVARTSCPPIVRPAPTTNLNRSDRAWTTR
ncbi:hypothetical protein [Nocardia sp. BMG51109]|uniref:hypothetical protein n=1 Tax=Nocardia sp. BMG51109 TaxID=1056816 RepID=UPI0004668DE3|nr:hypothetical protein [Nocardia sp. BMG51109]